MESIPKEIYVALISLLGLILSVIVSWFVARYKAKMELKKMRLETHHIYADNLIRARLTCYPEAYKILESIVKNIQSKKMDFDSFNDLVERVNNWYSDNGYLLSADTNRRFYSSIRKFTNIGQASPKAFEDRLNDNLKRKDLITSAWKIELGLKNDLGIFELEFFNPDSKFSSYKEIDETLNENQ